MGTMLTAEEFIFIKLSLAWKQTLIGFAKLHVEAALEHAEAQYRHHELTESDDPSYLSAVILKSYPLTNIK